MIYADTSFLVSLYTLDANSDAANACLATVRTPIAITPFSRLELRNAIRLRAFREQIESSIAHFAFRQIDEDMEAGILVHTAVSWPDFYRKADEISESYPGCRTLDLMHIATAVILGCRKFFTFDERQHRVAVAAGLSVIPK